MNVEIGRQNIKTTQFHFWVYTNRPLYWILTGPSFAVWCKKLSFLSKDIRSSYEQKISSQIRLMEGKDVF
jgi:hypothetical protein